MRKIGERERNEGGMKVGKNGEVKKGKGGVARGKQGSGAVHI